jgi:hypothetical protein
MYVCEKKYHATGEKRLRTGRQKRLDFGDPIQYL